MSFEKIQNLVGGKKAFEKLPILNIGTRRGETGYIDFIKPEEMTTSIMKGQDIHGRTFLSIRAKDHTQVYCQTFFQRYPSDRRTWSDAGDLIVSHYSGYLIDDGKIKDITAYNNLKALIKTGTLNNHTLY